MIDELVFIRYDGINRLDSYNVYKDHRDITIKTLPKKYKFVGYAFNNILKLNIRYDKTTNIQNAKIIKVYFD